jgi:hypothetical protein
MFAGIHYVVSTSQIFYGTPSRTSLKPSRDNHHVSEGHEDFFFLSSVLA